MVPFKREKGIAAAVIAVAASAAFGQQVAEAICSSQASSGHCYAIGETTGIIADGAAARFEVRNYTAPDWQSGGFTEQTLWVGVENSTIANGEWCEIGWTKGFINPNGQADANYAQYFAWLINGDYQEFFPYYGVGGPGTSHHYQIHREYDGKYNFYINNTDVGDCYANPFTLWVQTGLEYTAPYATAQQNDPRSLQWRRATDLTWFDWGSLGTTPTAHQVSDNGGAHWRWETYPTSGENWAN